MGTIISLQSEQRALRQKAFKEIYEYPPVMLVEDVKEFTRLGTNKVYEILRHPKCPTRRFGTKLTVYRDEFIQFYLENRNLLN